MSKKAWQQLAYHLANTILTALATYTSTGGFNIH